MAGVDPARLASKADIRLVAPRLRVSGCPPRVDLGAKWNTKSEVWVVRLYRGAACAASAAEWAQCQLPQNGDMDWVVLPAPSEAQQQAADARHAAIAAVGPAAPAV